MAEKLIEPFKAGTAPWQKPWSPGEPVLDAKGKLVKENVILQPPRAFFATVFNAGQIDGLPPIQQKTEQQWDVE